MLVCIPPIWYLVTVVMPSVEVRVATDSASSQVESMAVPESATTSRTGVPSVVGIHFWSGSRMMAATITRGPPSVCSSTAILAPSRETSKDTTLASFGRVGATSCGAPSGPNTRIASGLSAGTDQT